MKILVTGTSGFIGHHVATMLSDRGAEVLGIDVRTPSGPLSYRFQACDMTDRDALNNVVAMFRPVKVVHLAARADVDQKADLNGYAVNISGVENLIAAIRSTGSVKRAIYTSSHMVCQVGYRPQHDQDYRPNTVYGASKAEGERIVRREDGGGVEWCIVRPTTVWGPGMSAHYRRFLGMIRSGRYFHVSRKPLIKMFGFILNVAEQYARLLEAPKDAIHQRTFYVADYEPISLQTWADVLADKLGAPPIRVLPTYLARTAARIGDVLNAAGWRSFPFNTYRLNNVLTEYIFDLSNTRAVCGESTYSLDAAAELTAKWFLVLDEAR